MSKKDPFYHVFLSFRGETRNKFTCFLHDALEDEGFVAFMDKRDIDVRDEVHSTIKEAIRTSMSAIIIIFPNYAYSAWCLDELVLILERMKSCNYFIIRLFYEVEVRDIKHQLGNYGTALTISLYRLFRAKMVAKFPEYNLPMPKSSSTNGSSPSSMSRPEPSNNQVILYTISGNNGLGANGLVNWLVKKLLEKGNVVFEQRNCSKEPKFLRELVELVGNDKVRFPTVIVNGKDLCGEEVEGLDDYANKHKLVSVLKMIYGARCMKVRLKIISQFDGSLTVCSFMSSEI